MAYVVAFVLLITSLLQAPTNGDALLDAARAGDRARVARAPRQRRRCQHGVALRRVSALGFAAERGHVDVVRLLVDRGANINVADSFYGSARSTLRCAAAGSTSRCILLERGSQGAVGVLNAGIRAKNAAAVKAALATKQADAAALANARHARRADRRPRHRGARQCAAAAGTPAVAPTNRRRSRRRCCVRTKARIRMPRPARASRSAFDGARLTLSADGQPAAASAAVEERRFIADEVAGSECRLRRARRHRRTARRSSAAPRPCATSAKGLATRRRRRPIQARVEPRRRRKRHPRARRDRAARGKPQPWPAFRGANAAGVADGQGAVAEWDAATGTNVRWKTPIPAWPPRVRSSGAIA